MQCKWKWRASFLSFPDRPTGDEKESSPKLATVFADVEPHEKKHGRFGDAELCQRLVGLSRHLNA